MHISIIERQMRIAIVASIWISVPPKGFGFGAQEYIAYYIASALWKKGHKVTLFATGDSKHLGKLVSVWPTQLMDMDFPDPKVKDMFELINLSAAYKKKDEFDIIHNHLLPYGALFAELTKTPTVHTLHHEIYKTRADFFVYQRFRDQNYVSISNAQRQTMPQLNYIKTIHNGTDTNFYAFQSKPSDNYLLYIGRLKKYKGIHTAIQLAKSLGITLKIATPLPTSTQADYDEVTAYWKEEIEPNLSSSIQHIDNVENEEKITLMQNAKALIFPVEREEPFGMTIIESMSVGTPVVAYAMGATPELIKDGKTGFLINMSDKNLKGEWLTKSVAMKGLSEAVQKIYRMPGEEYSRLRKASRLHVEQNFTVEKMVDAYERVYQKLL